MKATIGTLVAATVLLLGCGLAPCSPDIGGLCSALARQKSPQRNPAILIPGLLGTKLLEENIWLRS